MNSDTILFNRTVKHSLNISSTTLGENKIFMFNYGIYMCEWYILIDINSSYNPRYYILRYLFDHKKIWLKMLYFL